MSMDPDQFFNRLKQHATAVEAELAGILDSAPLPGERQRPARLLAGMRHGVLNGGKRLRPALVLESAILLGGDENAALRVAAALECVHCYSLVHDDLPAMDDDDLRRGLPTVHKAYDEATAILAGDSLLTLAFDILAAPQTVLGSAVKLELVLALARAAGIGGMAGGQALDLQAEKQSLEEAEIIDMQAMKTGALIRFACEAGAVVANVTNDERQRFCRFGESIGLAFQLRDDLLDLKADAAVMGKATGKDAARGKATLVGRHGLDWAEERLQKLVEEAEGLLAPYGEKSSMLLALARYVASREK